MTQSAILKVVSTNSANVELVDPNENSWRGTIFLSKYFLKNTYSVDDLILITIEIEDIFVPSWKASTCQEVKSGKFYARGNSYSDSLTLYGKNGCFVAISKKAFDISDNQIISQISHEKIDTDNIV
jgi:hypothetical protein